MIHYILLSAIFLCTSAELQKLKSYNVDRNAISVSGVSAGAGMAVQMQVAFSGLINGCGSVAGIPYYCAQANMTQAIYACMIGSSDINLGQIFKQTQEWVASGEIDPTSNLVKKKVWIFHGTNDVVVTPDSGEATVNFFLKYRADVVKEFSINSGHGFPTLNNGVPCPDSAAPYINRCQYYAAYELLNHIYGGNLARPIGPEPLKGEFLEYDQTEFALGTDSFDADGGYIYVPSACKTETKGSTAMQTNETSPSTHNAVHNLNSSSTVVAMNIGSMNKGQRSRGFCNFFITGDMDEVVWIDHYILLWDEKEFEGEQFSQKTSYNRVGELNNIIIMYPQLKGNLDKGNPNGCYDWWGYDGEEYATKKGAQMRAVEGMINRAAGIRVDSR